MKINPDELLNRAQKSVHRVAYKVVTTGKNHRLGIGVTTDQAPSTFFIELLLTYCNKRIPNLQYLKELTEILRELEKQGYEIQCPDNHSFNCTKKIEQSTIQQEYEKVSSFLNLLHFFRGLGLH